MATWLGDKPVFYHCGSRVVDRRRVLGEAEKRKFLELMRMTERFTGCRVGSYCLMSNHFHLMLEVPRMPVGGLSDAELLERLGALYNQMVVSGVARELEEARAPEVVDPEGAAARIHGRYTYRMHNLGEFMKCLLQRFTQWFNRTRKKRRTGTLWERRFSSSLVEDGVGSKAVAAYGDLNPVRAAIVEEPSDYRWSSYGEAMGGGKEAQAGLVRVMRGAQGGAVDGSLWENGVREEYRRLLMEGVMEKFRDCPDGQRRRVRRGMPREAAEREKAQEGKMSLGRMLRCRVRYFTAGVAIGSRAFVDEAFANTRERFGARRKTGARRLRGSAAPAAGVLWSLRDLQKRA